MGRSKHIEPVRVDLAEVEGSKTTYKRMPPDAITYFGWNGLFAGISEGICAPMNEVEGYNKGFRDLRAKPR